MQNEKDNTHVEVDLHEQPVSVEIYDGIYNLRGTDPAYIEHLAAMVDAKMRAVAASGNTVDSLRVAVLASLNIADELQCTRDRLNALVAANAQANFSSRSASLSTMLDEVFDELEHAPIRRAG